VYFSLGPCQVLQKLFYFLGPAVAAVMQVAAVVRMTGTDIFIHLQIFGLSKNIILPGRHLNNN
jgi:hypothetical protein